MVPVYSRKKYFLKQLNEIWILICLSSLLSDVTLKKTLKTLGPKSLIRNPAELYWDFWAYDQGEGQPRSGVHGDLLPK